ncbi:MAG: molybdopterin molybdotransferase MoeA [Haloarculaceae archaeon]
MDEGEPASRTVAAERLTDRVARASDGAGTESVALARAGGRVLAAAVTAPADVPATDRATMDGYAVAAADDGPRRVAGAVFPEDDPPDLAPGEAVEVATGAPLPARADAVVMREDATVADGRLAGPPVAPGTNVYPAGATAAAGERLFEAGRRLAPRHAALLRDVGVGTVEVRRPLSVAVLATGTEIYEGRQPDRDSEMLCNLVRRWGHRPVRADAVPDDSAAVRQAIETAAADHDLVVTTGGTSVGRADHVVDVLREHDLAFRGVALRPGRPVAAATVDGTPVCALPGKPIAAHVAATLVLRPALAGSVRLPTVTADLAARVTLPDADLEYAIPVTLDDGATPLGHADSSFPLYGEQFAPGRVASSTRVALADGLLLTRTAIEAGADIEVVPYEVVE